MFFVINIIKLFNLIATLFNDALHPLKSFYKQSALRNTGRNASFLF